MKQLTSVLLALVLGIPVSLLGGIVLQDLWGWFIEPMGVVALTLRSAIGLMVVSSFFKIGLATLKAFDNDDLDETPVVRTFVFCLFYTVATLLSWGIGAMWNLLL